MSDVHSIADLKPDPKNRRKHNPRNIGVIRDALGQVGAARSIVIDEDNVVLAGNGVIEAAADAGIERVQVVDADGETIIAVRRTGLSEDAKRKLALYDNRTAELAEWDTAQLVADLEEGLDFEGVFREDELQAILEQAADDLLKGNAEPPEAQPDRAEELRGKWQTERGQVWEVPSATVPGKCHRLMCGDSTSAEDVERLMAGEKADMVFTDPPYNVASEGRNYAADAPTQRKTYEALKNAEWDKDFDITAAFPALEQMMAADCACYVCTSQWLVHTVWEWMWKWSKFCSYCVWCKPNPAPSLAKRHWTWATEMIAYAVRGKHVANFPAEGHALNWWEVTSPSHTTDHPTEKPITIPTRAIEFSSNRGAIVGDLFVGSGTTLVAAEQLGRLCYGMEIEPKYVAVALQRLADMGLEPRLTE